MASMGETCEELGYHFYWPAWESKPHLWQDGSNRETPLMVLNRVPFLMGAISGDTIQDLRDMVRQQWSPQLVASPGHEHIPTGMAEQVLDEFFDDLFRQFIHSADFKALNLQAVASNGKQLGGFISCCSGWCNGLHGCSLCQEAAVCQPLCYGGCR